MRFLFFLLFCPLFLFAISFSEKILDQMSLDEKIGQLFMIPACPKRDFCHLNDLEKTIKKFHIGGVIVKQSDPESQIKFLNYLQSLSKYPLIVSADAEWGLGMRMEKTISFLKNMTLGAIDDDDLLYELGKEIGLELKAVGVHINLAPVVDINCRAKNPTINIRAFSDDKNIVTKKAYLLMKGMQDENIIACLKHFPGYGDVLTDPHLDLPVAYHETKRLNEIELFPYDFLIKNSAKAIMTGHIMLPKLCNKPATMSKEILDILLNQKNYKNLLITDALNMKALTKHYSIEDIAFYSHLAGNDILLYGDHIAPNIDDILLNQVPIAFKALKEAYVTKKLDIAKLNKHVLKILKAKEKLNLFENRFTPPYDANVILNPDAYQLKYDLFKKALTIVKNGSLFSDQKLNFNNNSDFVYLSSKKDISQDLIALTFALKNIFSFSIFDIDYFSLPKDNISILTIYQSDLSDELFKKMQKLDPDKTLIIFLGSPYLLKYFVNDFNNILLGYEEEKEAIQVVIDFILNNFQAKGVLPIDLEN